MAKVRIENQNIYVGKDRVSFFSGEVHYWRLDPSYWENILDRIIEMNMSTIATYIPWEFHEVEKGNIDFSGRTHPRRNLIGFLELVKRKKLWLIIRPGPYIYSEWVNCGVPDRVVEYHRLHPEFQYAAHEYIQSVVEVLKPYFATNDGNIFLLQADNEIDPWVHWYDSQLGLGDVPGLFQSYLKDLYKDIEVLNRRWRTNYTDFDQGRVICENIINEKGYLCSYIDYKKFLLWYSSECARWFIDQYRKAGVDVPIYFNFYPWFDTHHWQEYQEIGDLVGVDLYPASLFDEDPSDHRKFCQKVLYLNTFSTIPYIAEFECGIWHGHHYFSGNLGPSHYRLMCFSALASGVKGWNWYMLVNRDNWYQSPINEWGRRRPELYSTFCEIIDIINWIQPSELERITESSVTFDYMHRVARTLDADEGVLKAFYDADVDFEFYDTMTGKIKKRILFYSGNQWLSQKGQENIHHYIESGGIFVVFQVAPRKDDDFNKLNMIQIRDPDRVLPSKYVQVTFGAKRVMISSPLFHFRDVPGEALKAVQINDPFATQEEVALHRQLPVNQEYTCGYVQKIGKGKLMVLGVVPNSDIILAVHEYFGIPIGARSETPDIKATAFRLKENQDQFIMIIVNNGQEDKHAKISLNRGVFRAAQYSVENLLTMKSEEIQPIEDPSITVFLHKKDGVVLKINAIDPMG